MNNMRFDFPVYHNPLKTREDLKRSLEELLAPLSARAVPGGFHLGSASAQYPPEIARMEGWSRCLWGIAPFVAGGGDWPAMDGLLSTLSRGVDPEDGAYWGDCGRRDQRLVEMAAIALGLILAPGAFWEPLDEKARQNLYRWLSFIEREELPPTNWHFFRLMVQAAFRKLGLPVDSRAEEASFELMESCYRGDGWYQDGEGGSFDLYNPMGFHFYGLVLAALEERRKGVHPGEPAPPAGRFAEPFRERARAFGPSFAAWFYRDGSMIPYGRSLTYRFAGASFFSACAFAGLEVLPWGVMKGIVMRNLRRWFSLPILDAGGLLSVGCGYPNLVMADAYNSPGSPYWALKAYLVLALGEEHPFWQAEEAPLPETPSPAAAKIPGFIVSSSAEDAQLLNAGRYPGFDMNHAAQKYCKFAYSARFGFCVSHSNYNIEKTGCDSALLFSEGDGYWRERRETTDQEAGENWVRSRWRPWADVEVLTVLVRLGSWHVRIHRVQSGRSLLAVEGGFSVPRFNDAAEAPPLRNAATAASEAFVLYPWAASRIAALEESFPGALKPAVPRRGALVVPAPNLNVLHPVVVIPVLEGRLEPGTTFLACAVRAGDGAPAENAGTAAGENLPKAAVQEESSGRRNITIFDSAGGAAAEIAL
jgi:hypothetical protein